MTAEDLPRVFALDRHIDVSGVSGTGLVAFGTWYPVTEKVTLSWLGENTGHAAVSVYDSLAVVAAIHCHGGATELVWLTGVTWPRRDLVE
ncbi:hypothetical protein Lfu02_32130 [Longispora fulva]|uniref:Uncharacterized protein n=1 Tax=Longispora fulva TaxID=619741 RepID=A0A8J7GHN4_9ACTN|nr:hypothetical protein [Longispora fulva]MBG6139344.1 hypothetical protein [Longispora fulva]GIG58841.1 hypothetical protein Lfu02_32130 [Longispora fulva]